MIVKKKNRVNLTLSRASVKSLLWTAGNNGWAGTKAEKEFPVEIRFIGKKVRGWQWESLVEKDHFKERE